MTRSTETSVGQAAYDACQQYLASHDEEHHQDLPSESWEELPPIYREAWQAAAEAAIARKSAVSADKNPNYGIRRAAGMQ